MTEESDHVIEHGKAVMNYPGAKARLAPWIIDHLPEHNTFVEVADGGDKLNADTEQK